VAGDEVVGQEDRLIPQGMGVQKQRVLQTALRAKMLDDRVCRFVARTKMPWGRLGGGSTAGSYRVATPPAVESMYNVDLLASAH